MNSFTFPIRVYYEDTDAAGIVYYANYLKFAERARTEWLRQGGISQAKLMNRHPDAERSEVEGSLASGGPSPSAQDDQAVSFVVRKVSAEFFAPARLDDLLTISSEILDIRKVRFSMRQTILRSDEKLTQLLVDIACVDRKMKPVSLPQDVKELLRG